MMEHIKYKESNEGGLKEGNARKIEEGKWRMIECQP